MPRPGLKAEAVVERLRSAMAKHHWTQRHVAKHIGVSARMVRHYLAGEHRPRPETLERILVLLRS